MCLEIDGRNYLEADLRISCDDNTYRLYSILGGISIAIYPFGVPLVFLAILTSNSHKLFLDEDIAACKADLEKQLQNVKFSQLTNTTGPQDGEFLADGAQHDQEKAQQQVSVLEAELRNIEEEIARHQRVVQMYGFIFAHYQPHAWYWEAGVLFAAFAACSLIRWCSGHGVQGIGDWSRRVCALGLAAGICVPDNSGIPRVFKQHSAVQSRSRQQV